VHIVLVPDAAGGTCGGGRLCAALPSWETISEGTHFFFAQVENTFFLLKLRILFFCSKVNLTLLMSHFYEFNYI